VELNQRLASLRATLGFLTLEPRERELSLRHDCFDTWRGIGDVVRGMARHGWDAQLTEYDSEHWRATFFIASHAHSIVGGTAWETTPWGAVQKAAWAALKDDPVSSEAA
jgi:hypothetical protein